MGPELVGAMRLQAGTAGRLTNEPSSAQRTVVEGATHEENKPENDKDTRALEQSYLARGQAQRVVELQG